MGKKFATNFLALGIKMTPSSSASSIMTKHTWQNCRSKQKGVKQLWLIIIKRRLLKRTVAKIGLIWLLCGFDVDNPKCLCQGQEPANITSFRFNFWRSAPRATATIQLLCFSPNIPFGIVMLKQTPSIITCFLFGNHFS